MIYVTRTILDTRVDEKMALLIKYDPHSISNDVGSQSRTGWMGRKFLLMSWPFTGTSSYLEILCEICSQKGCLQNGFRW